MTKRSRWRPASGRVLDPKWPSQFDGATRSAVRQRDISETGAFGAYADPAQIADAERRRAREDAAVVEPRLEEPGSHDPLELRQPFVLELRRRAILRHASDGLRIRGQPSVELPIERVPEDDANHDRERREDGSEHAEHSQRRAEAQRMGHTSTPSE